MTPTRIPEPAPRRFALRRPLGALAGTGLLALIVAGCGSSSSPGSSLQSGNESPRAAVLGFLNGLESGSAQSSCSYVEPSQQSACTSDVGNIKFTSQGVSVGNDFTNSNEAVVSIVATRACFETKNSPVTSVCQSNSNPNQGLPTSISAFATAYQNALNSSDTLTIACTEVGTSWYVNIGLPTGPTGGTGAGTTSSTVPGPTGGGTTATTAPGPTGGGTTATTAPGPTGGGTTVTTVPGPTGTT